MHCNLQRAENLVAALCPFEGMLGHIAIKSVTKYSALSLYMSNRNQLGWRFVFRLSYYIHISVAYISRKGRIFFVDNNICVTVILLNLEVYRTHISYIVY